LEQGKRIIAVSFICVQVDDVRNQRDEHGGRSDRPVGVALGRDVFHAINVVVQPGIKRAFHGLHRDFQAQELLDERHAGRGFDEQRQQLNDAGYYLHHDGKEERRVQQRHNDCYIHCIAILFGLNTFQLTHISLTIHRCVQQNSRNTILFYYHST